MEDTVALNTSVALLGESSVGNLWDILLVGFIIIAALFYLYRKLWTKRGACSDCTSGGPSCSGCQPGKVDFDTATPLDHAVGEKESVDG